MPSPPIACPNPDCRREVVAGGSDATPACPACGTSLFGDTPTLATPPPDHAAPGRLGPVPAVGRFEVRAKLGEGAFGEVFRGYDPVLGRDIALKVAKAGTLTTPERVARFREEARTAANLRHPNIVPVYETGEDGGRHFIVSAYVPGRTLEAVVRAAADRGEPVPFARAVGIVRRLAEALAYAHSLGVVHRDVKPANVMMDEPDGPPADLWRGEPLLMDFGLAARGETAGEAGDGRGLGTPGYMAPEQAAGRAEAASDQYALGCTLYELLTGRTPFGGTPQILEYLHREQPVPPPRSLRPDVPPDLEKICLRCLEKAPGRRYASCAELAEDLRRYTRDEPVLAQPPGAWYTFRKFVRRNRTLVATASAATVAVVAVATAAFLLVTDSRDRAVSLAGENGKLADRNGKLAVDMKGLAEEKGKLAEDNGKLAVARAVALDGERRQRDRAEWQLYRTQVEASLRETPAKNVFESSGEQLSHTRWDFRGWEYGLVRRQHRTPDFTFQRVGLFAVALDFSPDAAHLAVGAGADVVVFDRRTGERRHTLAGSEGLIDAVRYSPDGRFVVSASRQGVVKVWGADGKLRHKAEVKDQVSGLAVSGDGKRVAARDASRTVTVWDAASFERLRSDALPDGVAGPMAFAEGGEAILFAGKKVVRYDVATGAAAAEADFDLSSHSAVSGDGSTVATVHSLFGGGWQVQVFRRPAGPIPGVKWTIGRHPAKVPDQPKRLALSHDGEWAAVVTSGKDYVLHTSQGVATPVATPAGLSMSSDNPTFSRDGRYLAMGSGNPVPGDVGVWDLADLRFARWRPLVPGFEPLTVTGVVCRPDRGVLVVARGTTGTLEEIAQQSGGVLARAALGEVEVWDFPGVRDRPRHRYESAKSVRSLAVSPDATACAYGTAEGLVVVRDLSGGEPVELKQHEGPVYSLAYSPDGLLLVSGGADKVVRVWDVPARKVAAELDGPGAPVKSVAHSPDGRLLAAGYADGTIRLWDAKTRGPAGECRGHGGPVNTLAFNADGSLLASGGGDFTTRLWDARTRAELWTGRETEGFVINFWGIGGDLRDVPQVAFTPDGSRVVSLVGRPAGRIRFRDTRTGHVAATLTSKATQGFGFDPRGDHLVGVGYDAYQVWRRAAPGADRPRLLRQQAGDVRACAASPDGRLIACGGNENAVSLYDARSGQPTVRCPLDAPCAAAVFSPDSGLLVCAAGNDVVAVGTDDGRRRVTYRGHADEVVSVDAAGAWVAAGGKGKSARVWRATGEAVAVLEGHEARVAGVALLDGGAKLATGSWDGKLRVWDVAGKAVLREVEAHGEGVTCVAATPDGKYLLTGGLDGEVAAWDLSGLREVARARAHKETVHGIAPLAGGPLAVSAGVDGVLRVWDPLGGKPAWRVVVGGEGVVGLAAARSGPLVVTGCKDGVARVWDLTPDLPLRYSPE